MSAKKMPDLGSGMCPKGARGCPRCPNVSRRYFAVNTRVSRDARTCPEASCVGARAPRSKGAGHGTVAP
jgi:hypothetical protein